MRKPFYLATFYLDTKHSKECRNTLEKFADFYSPQALEILENTTTDEKGQISHELVIGNYFDM